MRKTIHAIAVLLALCGCKQDKGDFDYKAESKLGDAIFAMQQLGYSNIQVFGLGAFRCQRGNEVDNFVHSLPPHSSIELPPIVVPVPKQPGQPRKSSAKEEQL